MASPSVLTEILGPIGPDTHFRRAFPDSTTDVDDALRRVMAPPASVPGYEIVRELGRGGMGVVFLARHVKLNRLIALKVLLSGRLASREDQARFRREVEAVAKLQHPNIVQVFEVGDCEGSPYAAFEFVDGQSLAAKLLNEAPPLREAVRIVACLARALAHAHEAGILHRDLKPGNILISRDGQTKVTDFGLAKRIGSQDSLTATGTACGTPQYMAPEQITGRPESASPAMDLYGLGSILYELLTGRPPFEGSNTADILHKVLHEEPARPRAVNTTVPADLETIALKCLEKEPSKRYASAAALADDLERWLDGRTIAARPVGRLTRGLRWCRRNPAAAALMATLLVASVVSTGFAIEARRAMNAESEAKATAETARDTATAALEVAATARESERKERLRSEANYEAARTAMQESVTRLVNDSRIRDYGAGDLAKSILEDYRPFIERMMAINPDKPVLLNEDSYTLVGLGQFAVSAGDYAKAEECFRLAIDRGDRSCVLEPAHHSYAFAGAIARAELADLFARTNRFDEATPLHGEALAAYDRLIAEYPMSTNFRKAAARAHLVIANLATRSGDHAGVVEHCKAVFEQTTTLRERLGDQTELLQLHASALNNLHVAEQKLGMPEESMTHLKECIAMRRALAEQPGLTQRFRYRAELAVALDNLGQTYSKQNKLKEAEAAYADAVKVSAEVIRDAPSIVGYQIERARYLTHHASNIIAQRRVNEGLKELAEAEALARPVFEKTPELLNARDTVRIIHRGRATAYEVLGRNAEAAKEWAAVVPLAPNEGMKNRFQAWQATCHARAGEEAESRALLQAIDTSNVENADLWFDVAGAYGALANTGTDDAKVASDIKAAKAFLAKIDARIGAGTSVKLMEQRKGDFKKVRE